MNSTENISRAEKVDLLADIIANISTRALHAEARAKKAETDAEHWRTAYASARERAGELERERAEKNAEIVRLKSRLQALSDEGETDHE